MAHRRVNLTKGVSSSVGATSLALNGVPPRPYRPFSAALAHGDTVDVMVTHREANEWQAATYSYDFTANTLTFRRLLDSSTGSAISFSPGIKDIEATPLAQDAPAFDRVFDVALFRHDSDGVDD